MDLQLSKIRKYYPSLPMNYLKKIYDGRCERLKVLMRNSVPEDVRWLIEAKVRLAGETSPSFKHFPGLGKSSFAKKRRAKRVNGCHKCARWTCNTRCKSVGFTSINREDKISFIKDGLSKESLDDIRLTLETHPCGIVQRELLALWSQFISDSQRYSLGNLTKNDPVCQSIRRLDGKPIPTS